MYPILRPRFIGVAFLLLLTHGCKKKAERLDGDFLQPADQHLLIQQSDTFELEMLSVRVDSVRSDGASYQTLGSYRDSEFGLIQHSFATQVRLSTESIAADELAKFTLDSCILSLVYAGRYGYSDKQNFKVYELQSNLTEGTAYFSNSLFEKSSLSIGELQDYTGDLSSGITIDGESQNPQMRFRLNEDFGNRLLRAGNSVYASNTDFLSYFKGFVIQSENGVQTENTGGIYYFDLLHAQSRLMLYYRDGEGVHQKLEFLINSNAVRVNLSANDYTSSIVENAWNQPETGMQKGYIQSMGGSRLQIRMPNILALQKSGKSVVVNKAELVLPLSSGTYSAYQPMSKLYAFELKPDGTSGALADQTENHYNGELDGTKLQYKCGITRYLQNILLGKQANNPLIIRDLNSDASRVILDGTQASSPAKLVVTYFEVNQP